MTDLSALAERLVHGSCRRSELDMDDERDVSLPRGGIVGMARIVDCVTTMDSRWFFGPFGFVLRDAFPLSLVPCKGVLGFFTPPADVNAAVAALLRAKGASND
jgi:hypothetical protein